MWIWTPHLTLAAQCGDDSKCRFFCFVGESSNSCALNWAVSFSLLPSAKAPLNNWVSAFENQGLHFSTEIVQLLTALPQSSIQDWVAVVWAWGCHASGGTLERHTERHFRGSQPWPMYFFSCFCKSKWEFTAEFQVREGSGRRAADVLPFVSSTL